MNPITLYQFSKKRNTLVKTLVILISGGTPYYGMGGVLAPNGKIYSIPYNSPQILEFNPTTGSDQLVGPTYNEGSVWRGGVLAPNGKIYFTPYNANQILELDTTTNTTQLVGSSYSGTYKWAGGTVAPNGKIYFTPTGVAHVLEISEVNYPNIIGSDTLIPSNLSDLPTSNYNKYYNKF